MKNLKGILVVTLLILGQGLLFSTPRLVSNSKIPLKSDRATISVNTLGGTVTAADLVQTILGGGVTPSNIVYTGANVSAGTFTGGVGAGLGIPSGVILCSGQAQLAIGPNSSTGASFNNGALGDADLNALIGGTTFDASVLEFDFIPQTTNVQFTFVMGSEEYPEYITSFNDVFAFFLNGVNIAYLPGTSTPISIYNVNHTVNTTYYVSNDPPSPFDIQCDGFTVPISLNATVIPNQVNHIKLAVADAFDNNLDTWVFLNGESFISGYNVFVDSNPQGARIWIDGAPTALFTPNNISQVTGTTRTYSVDDDGGPFTFHPLAAPVPNIHSDQSLFFTGTQDSLFSWYVTSHEIVETPPGSDVWIVQGGDLGAEIKLNGASFSPPIYTPHTFTYPGDWVPGEYSVVKAGYGTGDPGWNPVSMTFTAIANNEDPTDFQCPRDDGNVPVELSSFTASLTADKYVRLTWVSQSESNMWGYRVYRSESQDPAEMLMITPTMYQAGNTSSEQTYNHVDNEVEVGTTYYYWLESVEYNSNVFHGPVSVTVENTTTPALPAITLMEAAYPNPFRTEGSTNIKVTLKENGTVTIYNLLGQVVRTFAVSPGTNTVNWDGRDSRNKACGNGVYFYKLSTASYNETRKLVIMK